MRILLVEDEPDLNHLIVKKLQLEHYTVDSCFNGLDGLERRRLGEAFSEKERRSSGINGGRQWHRDCAGTSKAYMGTFLSG